MTGTGKSGKDGRAKGAGKKTAAGARPLMAATAGSSKAAAALKESEEKYKLLIETTNTGYVIIDEQGRVLDANEEYVRLTGHASLEEIAGRAVTEWTAAYDLKRNAVEVRKCMECGSVRHLMVDYVSPQGRVTPVEINATMLRGAGSPRIFTVCRDITERKRAEEDLRESESTYRGIINTLSEAVYIQDEKGIFIDVNRGAEQMYGYTRDEFIGMSPDNVSAEGRNDLGRVAEQFRLAFDGEHQSFEFWGLAKNGRVFPKEVHLYPSRYFGRKAVVAIAQDITERKRAEARLRESEKKYRTLFESATDGIFILDLEGNFIDVNPAAHTRLGYTKEEFLALHIRELDAPEFAPRVPERLRQIRERGVAVFESGHRRKDGSVMPVEVNSRLHDYEGKPVYFSVIRDITERKQAEAVIAERGAMLQQIFDTSSVGIGLVDKRGRFTRVNRRMAEMFGCTMEELAGCEYVEYVQIEQREAARENMLALLASTITSVDLERLYLRSDGTTFWGHLACRRFHDAQGNELGLIGVISDITERKQAEEALRKSEKLLQTIIDAEPECVKLLDENANLIMMNKAGLDMLEVESLDDVKGQCVCPLVTSEYRQPFLDLVKGVFQGESGNLLFEMVGMKGRHLWMETHAVPLRNEKDEITAFLGVTRDVTERKRAEEEALRNEARMASLYRISQYPLEDEQAFLDLALHEAIALTNSAIGYLYFYDEAKREFILNSYSRDVMRECTIAEKKTCYELARTGIWGEAVRQRKPIILNDFDADHPLKKGYPEGHARLRKFLTTPVIMQGAVVAVIGVANKQGDYTDTDVLQLNLLMDSVWNMTQRARAVRALQESEERFRSIIEHASSGILVAELATQRFLYANPEICRMLGYDAEELLTLEVAAIHPADELPAVLRNFAALTGVQTLCRRKDGTIFPVDIRSVELELDGKKCLVGFFTDISERQLLEEERIKTQKLESLGTLAGGIAHDFNNLLQGVFGYISMAKLTHDQREKSLAMLEQAEKALHQSVSLTSQLLTFSKGGKPLKKMVDLRPVIENAVKFALSGSRTTAELIFAEDLRPADADAGQIGQVIQNLVLNADQAMPEGGAVRVSVGNAPAFELPHSLAAGNYIMISLQDSGVGIPQKYLKKIFDPYFTTKEKGSGLGLATSYSIVKNHDGALEVRSEVGKGSTFTIYLPASERSAAAAAAARPEASSCMRACRVLVMDDEELVRNIANELLTGLGHRVDLAGHGEEAVEKYRQAKMEGKPFDIVILDLTIRGGMGGAETMRRLRELEPGVKAIVSSGYSDDDVVASYREHGFAAFLKKPYDLTELQATLNELLV